MSPRTFVLLAPLVLLQGCWFIFIPGSVTSAISDSITGAEGQNCVGENVKVGDTIRLPGGGRGVVKSLSGTSMRCTNAQFPIRALLDFSEEATTTTIRAPNPALKTTKVALTLPSGWEQRPLAENMKFDGLTHALNRTTDTGLLLSIQAREGISDLMAFTVSRRASQASRLGDAQMSQISEIQVKGRLALRYQVTGMTRGQKITYLTTVIEGNTEIAILNAWTSAANFEYQRDAMNQLSENVGGLAP